MGDQLPAEVDPEGDYPKQAKQMFAKLAYVVNSHSFDRSRARSLVLFEDRDAKHPISKVRQNDLPQTELILHHRNQILRLDKTIAGMHDFLSEKIAEKRIDGLLSCMEEVTKWEAQRLKHLQMMEALLDNWTDQLSGKETMMAKLAADAAHLSQKASEHKDKMILANKSAMIPTTAELKQRLAIKYGVPIEQVDAILGAKNVDVEPTDG